MEQAEQMVVTRQRAEWKGSYPPFEYTSRTARQGRDSLVPLTLPTDRSLPIRQRQLHSVDSVLLPLKPLLIRMEPFRE